VAKDRAAPFSRKHRRYWLPVTGGMILIGIVNVALGLCSYEDPVAPQRMEVPIPGSSAPDFSRIPAPVMRAFTARYPHALPTSIDVRPDGNVALGLARGRAIFRNDGTFVGEE
jgi:hypothetical protein